MSFKNLSQIVRHCHTRSNCPKKLRDEWKGVIGLELHAQLSTKSKLFSSAPAIFAAPTNSAVTLFDAAIPGTLPTLNKKAVELAVATGLALGCKINPVSYFDRKHYFYSDLPAGYQITQQRLPIAENGKVEYAIYQPGLHAKPYYKTSYIKQLQLEQDSGKSLHESTEKQCYVDLNRAGIALIEIVFQPDVENEDEACALIREVMRVLQRVGSCSCKMEQGALRVDINVSVNKSGSDLGVRTEIKNLGSINDVWSAIKYETQRQVEILCSGGSVKNETLTWDPDLKETKPMRDKEGKQDYRFMPEPNLPPLRLLIDEYSESVHKNAKSKNFIYNLRYLKDQVPPLPQEERTLLIEKFALNDTYAFNLVNQPKLFTYFMEIMEENSTRDPKLLYLLLMLHLMKILEDNKIKLNDCPLPAAHIGEVVDLLQKKRINKATAEHLLTLTINNENVLSPTELAQKNNLYLISSPKELKKICLRVIEREHVAVSSYRRKKKRIVFNELLGKIIEESKFRADTQVLPKVLTEVLDEIDE